MTFFESWFLLVAGIVALVSGVRGIRGHIPNRERLLPKLQEMSASFGGRSAEEVYRMISWGLLPIGIAVAIAGIAGLIANTCFQPPLSQSSPSSASTTPLFPFAGRVLVDGRVPGWPNAVVLKLELRGNPEHKNEPFAVCDADGRFQMGTFLPGDGAPPGKYVLVFAQLREARRHAYVGSDQLGNLYNDRETNARDARFVIKHEKPGKTDYQFDLKVKGVPPVETPRTGALTSLYLRDD
jgi:hypothetical protein